jgi:hypothetical protein
MKTFDLVEFERTVTHLAADLNPRQRYLCSILIIQNTLVADSLRAILMQALSIDTSPDIADPVCRAVVTLDNCKRLDPSDHRTRSAFTVLRSLGVMPDLLKSIKFIQALSTLSTGAIK